MTQAALIAMALLAAGDPGAAPAAAMQTLNCVSPLAARPLALGVDRAAAVIQLRETAGPRRQPALFDEDGFSAIFSTDGGKSAYWFTLHQNTGVLNVISFRLSRSEGADVQAQSQTPGGQAALKTRFGKKSMQAASGAMFMTCAPSGN